MNQSIAFYTLGCKLNFSESSALSQQAKDYNFSVVPFQESADVYVVNTCSVTEEADKKCRQIVRRALRKNPKAYIVVIGCYAQLKPKEIAEIPGVDAVLGAAEKFRLFEHLTSLIKEEKTILHACEIEDVTGFNEAYSYGDRTRTFLKVQDGCDYTCAFCTIPLARGKSRSTTIDQVIKQANAIAEKNCKEIVLTGVNLGDFGKGEHGAKQKEENFYSLAQAMDQVAGIERIRISSIEPNLLTDEIIEFVAQSKKFVPHFHIPLQSGSNEILGKMKRRYRRELYQSRIEKIKTLLPHCNIGVDVIVGFPGETEQHFLDTYQFLNTLDITYLHVFTYSERENTLATTMEQPIPKPIRNERNKMLRILSEKKKRAFYAKHVGEIRPVLIEQDTQDGAIYGYTDNYIRVELPYLKGIENQIIDVQLSKLLSNGNMNGEIAKSLLDMQYS